MLKWYFSLKFILIKKSNLKNILGNGDLASGAFGDSLSGNAKNLELLYNVSNTLIDTKTQISENKNSIAIETINKNLISLKSNFIGTTSNDYGTDSMLNQFLEYNKFADKDMTDTYQKGCSSNTKDFWTTDINTCKNGYVKVSAGTASDGNANCLLYSEWSINAASTRYASRPAGCSSTTGSNDFNSVTGALTAYHTALGTYSNSNSALIDEIIGKTNELNGGFVKMSEKLLSMIINMEGVLNPLVNIFTKYVGNSGLFQLINCSNFIFI